MRFFDIYKKTEPKEILKEVFKDETKPIIQPKVEEMKKIVKEKSKPKEKIEETNNKMTIMKVRRLSVRCIGVTIPKSMSDVKKGDWVKLTKVESPNTSQLPSPKGEGL